MPHSPLRWRDKDKHRMRESVSSITSPKTLSIASSRMSTMFTTQSAAGHMFTEKDFDPEQLLASRDFSTQEDIEKFRYELETMKQTVAEDLQRNVYRNYTEFVAISKEISNLDSDVLQLKTLLNDLHVMWGKFKNMTFQSESAEATSAPTEKNHGLRAVEGLQAFNMVAPDSRVLFQCLRLRELDTQTHKERRHAALFLLAEGILLCARKQTDRQKDVLVAVHYWSLQDVDVQDVKDSHTHEPSLMFKIIEYPKTYLYRCNSSGDKRALIDAYRRAQGHQSERYSTADKAEASLSDERWLTDLSDELEVMISLKEFEKAVSSIQRAREMMVRTRFESSLLSEVDDQLRQHTQTLCSMIMEDLGNMLLTKHQFHRNVHWMLRLGKGEEARNVFLATRSRIIKRRIRQLVFGGDIPTYISELALVVFTLVRNTCEWYRDSFKQNELASGLVTWVREQAEIYADIFRRQVFYQNQFSCQIIADCYRSTLEHCSMLRKVGVDLKFLMESLFIDNVRETIIAYKGRQLEKVERLAKADTFELVSNPNLGADVKVTASVIHFYNVLVKFVHDIRLLARLQLYDTVMSSITELTEHYLRAMLNESKKTTLTDEQRMAAQLNLSFVLDSVVPRVSSLLNRHFDRPIPELDHLRSNMRKAWHVGTAK